MLREAFVRLPKIGFLAADLFDDPLTPRRTSGTTFDRTSTRSWRRTASGCCAARLEAVVR